MSKRFVSRVAGSCALAGLLLGVPPAAAFDLAVSGFIRQEAAYRIGGIPFAELRRDAHGIPQCVAADSFNPFHSVGVGGAPADADRFAGTA